MHKKLLAMLLGASATAGQAVTINFNTPANTNPGPTASFGSPAVIATGYMCSPGCVTTDLYIKDLAPGERGLGLNNDPSTQHELWFAPGQNATPLIQLNVIALLALTSGASFTMNSSTSGEWWAVYGATGAGNVGATFLGNGNDELSHNFASWGSYNYYNFISLGTYTGGTPSNCVAGNQQGQNEGNNQDEGGCSHTAGNVLVSSLTYTPRAVPEPAAWAMMLLGFGGIGMAIRRRRQPASAQIA